MTSRWAGPKSTLTLGRMTVQRMEHVVDDLEAAIALFVELGLELEGETQVEGRWVDRIVGLDDVRADLAIVQTRTATASLS